MKKILAFFKAHKKSFIYLTAAIIIAAVLLIGRNSRAFVNFLTDNITTPFKSFLGAVNSIFPFSVMEIILILFVLGIILYLVLWIVSVVRGERKLSKLISGFFGILCILLTVYDSLYFLWGINYNADGFCEKSGLYDTDISTEDLYSVTMYFSDMLNKTAGNVPRNDDNTMDVTVEEIFGRSTDIYDNISETYTFLKFDDKEPKSMMFSHIMSMTNYTGIFFPLTGESNINTEPPACLIPATVAHELAHRRGIASEKECNFLGVLASVSSDDEIYEYSGWLLGYVYLENALYTADKDLWQKARESLSAPVLADMYGNNDFWAQYKNTAVSEAADKAYDGFLKSYGEENGIKSYGLVVDLLVSYYKNAA